MELTQLFFLYNDLGYFKRYIKIIRKQNLFTRRGIKINKMPVFKKVGKISTYRQSLVYNLIQKTTILNTSDITGVLKVNCFHLYQKKKTKFTGFGSFIKVSTREVMFKYKKLRKRKFKSIVILLKYRYVKPDGSSIFFKKNTCILLKRRVIAVSKLVTGCCIYNLKRKKFLTSFVKVI